MGPVFIPLHAVLCSRWLWRLDPFTGEVVKVEAGIRGSDFSDVAPSVRQGYWVTLAGHTLVDVTIDGRVVPTSVGNELITTTRGYAVGDKIAVMMGEDVKVSKQNITLVGVDATQCGAVAAGKGSIVYLKPERIEAVSVPNADFKSVSVNPRGAYALVGGSKGGLVLYDGYKATVLPVALHCRSGYMGGWQDGVSSYPESCPQAGRDTLPGAQA